MCFYSLHTAKPILKLNIKECLSLDILNFVPLEDFTYYMRWEGFNVKYLYHLLDFSRKDFLSFAQIRQNIKTNNFIRYYGLISNIPKDVKRYLRDNVSFSTAENFVPQDIFLQRLLLNQKIKFIYNDFYKYIVNLPTRNFLKWEEKIWCDTQDWSRYFFILRRCCRDIYLVNFQYKFLHRIVPTNDFLYKIHFKDTKICSFCNTEEETVEHLFFYCSVTLQFLHILFSYLNKYFHNIQLSKVHFLLGYVDQSLFCNLLIIIAKNYIYKCKFHNSIPNIVDLKNRLKKYYLLELYIAKKNNKLEGFERYWTPVKYIFPEFQEL